VKSQNNPCWDGQLADDPNDQGSLSTRAVDRYNVCLQTFGASYTSTSYDVDDYLTRDFPIIEAHDGYLKVGRFGWYASDPTGTTGNTVPESTTNRVIVGASDTNPPFLRLAQCCFHSAATFKVRTGGEWVAVGNASGYLHHVQLDPSNDNRCVVSCDARRQLLNSRSFDIPWSAPPTSTQGCTLPPISSELAASLGRESSLAMRNPMFSYVMWSGCGLLGGPGHYGDHTLTQRDDVWRFSMRVSFSPIVVSLAQGMAIPVSPQSMLFIESLGQLAIVDGAQQGLVLIDLNTLGFAHTPYY
jgi:hypothetical protein